MTFFTSLIPFLGCPPRPSWMAGGRGCVSGLGTGAGDVRFGDRVAIALDRVLFRPRVNAARTVVADHRDPFDVI